MGVLAVPLLAFMTILVAMNSSSELLASEMTQPHVEGSMEGNFRIYANAVEEFAHTHPRFVGDASVVALDLPDWFTVPAGVGNHVERERVSISSEKAPSYLQAN